MRDCTQLTAADKAALLTHYLENSSAPQIERVEQNCVKCTSDAQNRVLSRLVKNDRFSSAA